MKQLDFDCRRLKAGGSEMSRRDAYCKRQKVLHNISHNTEQYRYHRYISMLMSWIAACLEALGEFLKNFPISWGLQKSDNSDFTFRTKLNSRVFLADCSTTIIFTRWYCCSALTTSLRKISRLVRLEDARYSSKCCVVMWNMASNGTRKWSAMIPRPFMALFWKKRSFFRSTLEKFVDCPLPLFHQPMWGFFSKSSSFQNS